MVIPWNLAQRVHRLDCLDLWSRSSSPRSRFTFLRPLNQITVFEGLLQREGHNAGLSL